MTLRKKKEFYQRVFPTKSVSCFNIFYCILGIDYAMINLIQEYEEILNEKVDNYFSNVHKYTAGSRRDFYRNNGFGCTLR